MSKLLIPGSGPVLSSDLDTFTETEHDARDHSAAMSGVSLADLGTKDHDLLTGLADDDHSLYLKDSDFETASWLSHTPVLTASTTNPTLGSGSLQQGRYLEVGNTVLYRFQVRFGSSGTNAGDGQYRVSLPVNAAVVNPDDVYTTMGAGVLLDWSVAGHKELCTWQWGAAAYLTGVVDNASIFSNAPFDWTVLDRMSGTVTYQSA